jgi:hypothetical protein
VRSDEIADMTSDSIGNSQVRNPPLRMSRLALPSSEYDEPLTESVVIQGASRA